MVLCTRKTDVSVASNHGCHREFFSGQAAERTRTSTGDEESVRCHLSISLVFLRSFPCSCVRQMRLAFLGLVAGLTREREEEEPQSPARQGVRRASERTWAQCRTTAVKQRFRWSEARVFFFLVPQCVNYRTITKDNFTHVSTLL